MKLAINGGPKVRTELFPDQNTIGAEEIEEVYRVMKSGLLTGYKGNAGKGFHGGPQVCALEKEWGEYFGKDSSLEPDVCSDRLKESSLMENKLHCIPINSCTSGLFVACGAIGIEPGDEVIVTPYSMTCSATAPLIWGGKPVFADIHPLTFNLDPDDVERKITSHTKAIIVVDLFGLPYDERIDQIAAKHGLVVIEDAAQAVGAYRKGRFAGTLGDIGIFSFNQGKHLTCGEGGMICTYNRTLALKCRLLVNHGEAVMNDCLDISSKMETINYIPINTKTFGFNLRMSEIHAAIVRIQLSRARDLISKRQINVHTLLNHLDKVPGILHIKYPENYEHTYYALPLFFMENTWGVHRDKVVAAVKAELSACAGRADEGVTISAGYIKPIWRMPIFANYQKKKEIESGEKSSLTPICDRMWKNELILLHRFFGPNAEPGDMEQVAEAFEKVWRNRNELK